MSCQLSMAASSAHGLEQPPAQHGIASSAGRQLSTVQLRLGASSASDCQLSMEFQLSQTSSGAAKPAQALPSQALISSQAAESTLAPPRMDMRRGN